MGETADKKENGKMISYREVAKFFAVYFGMILGACLLYLVYKGVWPS